MTDGRDGGRRAPVPAVCAVYDGECALCRGAVTLGRRLVRDGSVGWVAAAGADTDAATRAGAATPGSLLVWDGGAEPLTESAAVAALVQRIPVIGRPLAWALRWSRPAADPVYRWLARHRHQVTGLRRKAPMG